MKFKIKYLKVFFNRTFYRVFYGVKYEKGYKYNGWKTSSDYLMEYLHQDKLDEGYEKYTDILFDFWGNAFCIYRKPIILH